MSPTFRKAVLIAAIAGFVLSVAIAGCGGY
jgi:hypothetical protein